MSALLFTRLSRNHLNNLVEASSKDLKISLMLFALKHGALSLAISKPISKSSIIKNKLIKKILHSKGPKIEPCSTPKIILCQLLYVEFIFVHCFLFDR